MTKKREPKTTDKSELSRTKHSRNIKKNGKDERDYPISSEAIKYCERILNECPTDDSEESRKRRFNIQILALSAVCKKNYIHAFACIHLASLADVSPPHWATELFDKAIHDVVHGRIKSLDVAFGFASESEGKGRRTEPFRQAFIDYRDFFYCSTVWKLLESGESFSSACYKVAQILATENPDDLNETRYDIGFIKSNSTKRVEENQVNDEYNRCDWIEERLRVVYRQWTKKYNKLERNILMLLFDDALDTETLLNSLKAFEIINSSPEGYFDEELM
ncbi:hypothetical protein [Nitrospira sp. M1]